tara:strand:+ start:622 stop:861 length:240 start_codon:yes stop_codon:yes gene_type:complete
MTEEQWTEYAEKRLIGKRIVDVFYMSEKEMEELGWSKRPLYLKLNDGSIISPQRDDEGNDGGALYYFENKDNETTLPVL